MSLARIGEGRSPSCAVGVAAAPAVIAAVLIDPGMWPLVVLGVLAFGITSRRAVGAPALPGGGAAGLLATTFAVGLSGLVAPATRSEHAVIALVLLGATLSFAQPASIPLR